MKYFKNRDITRLYNISDKTVRNWIEASQKGSLGLQLYERSDGKSFIMHTIGNENLLESLVLRARKYRNQKSKQTAIPLPSFYELYSKRHITDIISSIDKHREYPQHYRYVGEGAEYWNAYLNKLLDVNTSNYVSQTRSLIEINFNYLDTLIKNFSVVNVIDLGVGNGVAAKVVIEYLNSRNKMGAYKGIDISQDLLNRTEENLRSWFPRSLPIEKHIRDLTFDRFDDIIGIQNKNTVNLVLFLGGTITNFKNPSQPLQNIYDSMSRNDILISTLKLDSIRSRRFFDFNTSDDQSPLPRHDKYVLDLLGINEVSYTIEQFFDEISKSRYIQIRLKTDLTIDFKVDHNLWSIELQKGESILLWRALHFTLQEILQLYEKTQLKVLSTTKSLDEEYLFLTAKISPRQPINQSNPYKEDSARF